MTDYLREPVVREPKDYVCPNCGAELTDPWWLLVSCTHEEENLV